ncbi:MAG TPA: prephenate dehydratase domain-containing protein [Candidatus Acidoferrales bacterium]|nr:prephenate dehydratase domain-containing protein [Candidatus Acidoferrales bacterium]
MKIAIQGEVGSYSHQAAMLMDRNCSIQPCTRSADVFDCLERESVGAAIIPIENSLAGSVAEHLDLLLARKVFIQREMRLQIVHNLIAARGVRSRDLRRVFSHPVALDQCRNFFRRHRRIEPVPYYDTAGSVKHVLASGMRDAAAIAGRQAANVYQGTILATGLEDDKRNFTRFFLIRRQRQILPGANKTSFAFVVKNVPGALYRALGAFAACGIDLARIESRPIRGRPWQYSFFADILQGDDRVSRHALRALKQVAERVKILGVYPAA